MHKYVIVMVPIDMFTMSAKVIEAEDEAKALLQALHWGLYEDDENPPPISELKEYYDIYNPEEPDDIRELAFSHEIIVGAWLLNEFTE